MVLPFNRFQKSLFISVHKSRPSLLFNNPIHHNLRTFSLWNRQPITPNLNSPDSIIPTHSDSIVKSTIPDLSSNLHTSNAVSSNDLSSAISPLTSIDPLSNINPMMNHVSDIQIPKLSELLVLPDQTTSIVTTTVDHIGAFKELGLCNFTPVGGIERIFEYIHVYSGLPWWGTIIASTIVVRLFAAYFDYKGRVNEKIQPEMQVITAQIKEAQAKRDPAMLKKSQQDMFALFKANNTHPFNSLFSFVQPLVTFLTFYSLGKIVNKVPGLDVGGTTWFMDLTVADPTWTLSCVSLLMAVGLSETLLRWQLKNKLSSQMKIGIRFIPLLSFFFTLNFSAAVLLFINTTICVNLLQNLVYKAIGLTKNSQTALFINRPSRLYKYERLSLGEASDALERLQLQMKEKCALVSPVNTNSSKIEPIMKSNQPVLIDKVEPVMKSTKPVLMDKVEPILNVKPKLTNSEKSKSAPVKNALNNHPNQKGKKSTKSKINLKK